MLLDVLCDQTACDIARRLMTFVRLCSEDSARGRLLYSKASKLNLDMPVLAACAEIQHLLEELRHDELYNVVLIVEPVGERVRVCAQAKGPADGGLVLLALGECS